MGPALVGTRLSGEREDRDNGWPAFLYQQGLNAFICHYNEPVGPDLPVVQELIQILSPCVLRQALKKQMTHGSRPQNQYTGSLVIFMDADNTRPIWNAWSGLCLLLVQHRLWCSRDKRGLRTHKPQMSYSHITYTYINYTATKDYFQHHNLLLIFYDKLWGQKPKMLHFFSSVTKNLQILHNRLLLQLKTINNSLFLFHCVLFSLIATWRDIKCYSIFEFSTERQNI